MDVAGEIVRVRDDHGTLYMRIPRWFRETAGLRGGSYVVVRAGAFDGMEVVTLEKGLDDAKAAAGSSTKGH